MLNTFIDFTSIQTFRLQCIQIHWLVHVHVQYIPPTCVINTCVYSLAHPSYVYSFRQWNSWRWLQLYYTSCMSSGGAISEAIEKSQRNETRRRAESSKCNHNSLQKNGLVVLNCQLLCCVLIPVLIFVISELSFFAANIASSFFIFDHFSDITSSFLDRSFQLPPPTPPDDIHDV